MNNPSRYVIQNDLPEPSILNIEPEGHFVLLGSREKVTVVDDPEAHPVSVRLGKSDDGALVISLWPGDGEVRVEREGRDVLDERAWETPSTARPGPRVAKPAASS